MSAPFLQGNAPDGRSGQPRKKKRKIRFKLELTAEEAAKACAARLHSAAADGNLSDVKFALMEVLQEEGDSDEGSSSGGAGSGAGGTDAKQQQQRCIAAALYAAAVRGHLACVSFLLDNGADPAIKTSGEAPRAGAKAESDTDPDPDTESAAPSKDVLLTPYEAAVRASQPAAAQLIASAALHCGVHVKIVNLTTATALNGQVAEVLGWGANGKGDARVHVKLLTTDSTKAIRAENLEVLILPVGGGPGGVGGDGASAGSADAAVAADGDGDAGRSDSIGEG